METSANSSRAMWVMMGLGLLTGLLAGVVIFVGLPGGGSVLFQSSANSTPQTPAPAAVVGAPAPDFTLKSLTGETFQLSSLRGEVVLLNFWATWCAPCEAEMPILEDRYQTFLGSGFRVLGVNADDEKTATIETFLKRVPVSFPILLDPGLTVSDLYRVRGLPTTYVIDREGVVRAVQAGYLSDGQLDRYLSELGFPGQ
jgi:peroxiredoxin